VLRQHQLGAGLVRDARPRQPAQPRVRGLDQFLYVVFQRIESARAGASGKRRND
jgi:hypothetical protein